MRPVEPVPEGARLTLYVQPRASRTELTGLHGDALRIRIAAPPVEGAANLELVRFLARLLGVGRSSLELTAGIGARRKTVVVRGLTAQAVERKLGLAP